jgi:hypothetical protein
MQEKLFFDDENDALRAAIISAGGYKYVASKLWPSRKPDSAYARLKACLDPEKHEKLEFAEMLQIARMAREKGCHQFMQYLGTELGYQCTALDPQDEATQLRREVLDMGRELNSRLDRLEQIETRLAVVSR